MIKFFYNILSYLLPGKHLFSIKKIFRRVRNRLYKKIKATEFEYLLRNDMGIKEGDTVFIHSSLSKLNIDFDPEEILKILQSVVGTEGTLLFPCWQFNIRAEDYFRDTEKIFNVKKTKTKMGFLPEFVRRKKESCRSLHPTNSIVAIGRNAEDLIDAHHLDIFPCGIKSPFYKMMDYNAIIIGLGVDVDNLTFLHCIEDVNYNDFPIKTRMDKSLDLKVIDSNGVEMNVKTLVASKNISNRNPLRFFSKHVPSTICHRFEKSGSKFFVTDSKNLFHLLSKLSLENITIYNP